MRKLRQSCDRGLSFLLPGTVFCLDAVAKMNLISIAVSRNPSMVLIGGQSCWWRTSNRKEQSRGDKLMGSEAANGSNSRRFAG